MAVSFNKVFIPGRRFPIAVGLILGALLVTSGLVWADQNDNPSALPGWTHLEGLTTRYGVVLPGGQVTYSSPVIGEIDGNTQNGMEVAVGSSDGVLHVLKADGSLLWSHNLPTYGCAGLSSNNRLLSSPAIGNLLGDGMPYVVVGYGGVGGKSCDGGVVALRGSDGTRQWTFSLKKFAKKEKFGTFSHAVFSSPALADVDGDGKMEIGFGSFDRNVYLLNSNGKPRWYYNAADTIWSSPAFANVDADPKLELIIGTDISANSQLRPPTKNGGFVYAFKTKSRNGRRIYFRDKSAYVWQRYINQVVYSSPVVADVLPGNPGREVVVGAGCFFPQGSSNKRGAFVKIMRLSDGKVLQTLNAPACFSSSVAIGDLDNDGVNEIVATVNGHTSIGGDGYSRLVAWKATNPEPLWSVIPREKGRHDPYGGHFMSPVIADLDGNGSLEVIVANARSVGVFAGVDGTALTCQQSSCGAIELMLYAFDDLKATPAVGDINGDGKLDVVIAGSQPSSGTNGVAYAWTDFAAVLGSPSGSGPASETPWPMHRCDSNHRAVKE